MNNRVGEIREGVGERNKRPTVMCTTFCSSSKSFSLVPPFSSKSIDVSSFSVLVHC